MSMITMQVTNCTADADAVVTGPGTYYGCSVFAGTALIRDALVSSAGTIIQQVSLPGLMLGGHGVRFNAGLSVDIGTGPVTVYYTKGA